MCNLTGHYNTRQCTQGHRTYEVGITKCEVRFVLNLEALDLLVSSKSRKDVFGMKVCHLVSKSETIFSLYPENWSSKYHVSIFNIMQDMHGQNKFLICR